LQVRIVSVGVDVEEMDGVNTRVARFLKGRRAVVVALTAATALLLVPAGASAASPVLEFAVPGNSFPVSLTTAGGEVTAEGFSGAVMTCAHSSGQGEITGPHRAIAEYEFTECKTGGGSECESKGAAVEEIRTGLIEAELVYIDQKNREAAVLLNPHGGTYMRFECGGVPARGEGSFLAPGAPLNTETTSFTTTLSKSSMSGGVQTPDEYEGIGGEKLKAIPFGEKNNNPMLDPTGVESTITITTAEPVEVRAITAEEVEAKQREEAKEREEALQTLETTLKKQEEAVQALETTLKKQEEALKKGEEHAKQVGEETKKHEEGLNAQIVAIKKQQEEATAEAKKDQEEVAARKKQLAVLEAQSHPPARTQLLAKALRGCKKQPKNKRAQCEVKAEKKYGHKANTSKK
jgi:flagellar biosynthesis GTPase FlhF